MSTDVTTMLIELVKEVKEDVREVKEKVDEATVNIAIVETMQKAIENLEINERLMKVEKTTGQCDTVLVEFKDFRRYIIGTMISTMGVIIFELVKYLGGKL